MTLLKFGEKKKKKKIDKKENRAVFLDHPVAEALLRSEVTCLGQVTLHNKRKFSIKGFLSKCDQIGRTLWIRSHLPKKSLMENFNFCAVCCTFIKGDSFG